VVFSWLARDLRLRPRGSEPGAVPIVLGLTLIWSIFELQDPHFLTREIFRISSLVDQDWPSGRP
jgi:hypothetical protein